MVESDGGIVPQGGPFADDSAGDEGTVTRIELGETFVMGGRPDRPEAKTYRGYGVIIYTDPMTLVPWFVLGDGMVFWTDCLGHARAQANQVGGVVRGMGFDGEPVDLPEG